MAILYVSQIFFTIYLFFDFGDMYECFFLPPFLSTGEIEGFVFLFLELGMSQRGISVRIFFTLFLLFCSWGMLLQMAMVIRGVSVNIRIAKEFFSVALGIAAYAVLVLSENSRWIGASGAMPRNKHWKFFLIPLTVILVLHFLVHLMISARHRQTQEIMLLLSRFLSDFIMFFCGCAVLLGQNCRSFRYFWSSKVHGKNGEAVLCGLPLRRMRIAMTCGCVMIMVFLIIAPSFFQGDAKRFLEVGMLGDRVDFCGLEGLQLSSTAASGWVLPEYFHRRLLNAFTGSDQCGSNRISFLDDEEGVVIVSPICPDGNEQPTVYIERPERSELNGGTEVLPKVLKMSQSWHQTLEKRYGKNKTVHESMGVLVKRDSKGVIKSVEVIPSSLIPVLRKPRSDRERIARAGWLSKKVWVVPLGESGAYSIYCPSSDYEEYHIFPPIRHSKRVEDNLTKREIKNGVSPPASVLVLVLDAVSRQEVLRSLPKFSNWLRNFRNNESKKHVFVEAQGATTLAHSTIGNLLPLFTGNIEGLMKHREHEIMESSLFRLAKKKYGSRLITSYTMGDCLDVMLSLFGERRHSAGFGEPYGNDLDYHTFGPFCHIQYSALEGNFQGANSILRRCIGQHYVHEYVLNYTVSLLRRRLRRRRQEKQNPSDNLSQNAFSLLQDDAVRFFHILHLVEGHEGSHGVIYLVDNALTAFLEELRVGLGFFDDPSNVLLMLSDHGNHMGPYYELTAPGKSERALPFVGMIFHRELLAGIDHMKGYEAGSSLKNLMKRTRRVSTTLDLYMTLCDLLDVKGKDPKKSLGLKDLPLSFFDAPEIRSSFEKCSDIGALNSKSSGCYLMWCERKNR
ncbi:hypothetical protein MOQ_009397 [Trypanosoma cruzi marinkellei]|uniref:Uncharacterized protein n=1 Tax=Trypanosoma cruzi marinkellei TaxID=85056 RepID=K2NCV0_TRYCR|nr:hypothetical protein MOQ_009397 [Trypanosoma cruzi marinkellei]